MDKNQLMMQLQSLRHKLYEVAEAKGSFTDPDVIAISEEADQLIVALQYMKRNQEYVHQQHINN
ncbi:MAG TPA: aspartyl-phosphate phosphatase Spo0E family protein [Candidatus Paenibacillus intestinavium]|nr:aspartyl-phosphate phosphatase Spo0E family protein [Candidatus Paenibacillus intestinavium]